MDLLQDLHHIDNMKNYLFLILDNANEEMDPFQGISYSHH